MSEFFKALEQAERDRARDNLHGPNEVREHVSPAEAPIAEPVTAKHTAQKSVPFVPRSVTERPATSGVAPTNVSEPIIAKKPPAFAFPTQPPANVFRSSLRKTDRPRVIGRDKTRRPVLVTLTDPSSVEADAYRTLRANIELMANGTAPRRVAITSPSGGDGKSTTAVNLAVVSAQAGRRVCLVDADLRRPTLHEAFGLSNINGLTLALEQGASLGTVAKAVDIDNLSVVVAGRGPDETFHDLLTSQRLEYVLRDAMAEFDFVVFDSPPVVVSDTLSVAAVADGVILVVRAGSIPFGVLHRAIGQVKQVNGTVLGVLLNQGDPRRSGRNYYSYEYHRPGPTNGR